ncbi:MAG: hypothetical protein WBG86_16030 [Polyangiales bacterium]
MASESDVNVNGHGAQVYPQPPNPVPTPTVVHGVDGSEAFVIVKDGYSIEHLETRDEGYAEHHFDDVKSFAEYLNRQFADQIIAGNPSEEDVDILVQSDSVLAIVKPEDAKPQHIRCDFVKHPAFSAWENAFNNSMTQRQIQQFVRAWQGTIEDSTALMAVFSAISVTGTAAMTSHIDENGATRLASAEGKTDVSVKIPSAISVQVPCYDGVERVAGELSQYNLDVLVSNSLDPITFTLTCPTLPLVTRMARHDVATQLRRELADGFLVGLGSAAHSRRPVIAEL